MKYLILSKVTHHFFCSLIFHFISKREDHTANNNIHSRFSDLRVAVLLIIISCGLSNIPQQTLAQNIPTSQTIKVLVGDAIQSLKGNDTQTALVHLNILSQALAKPASDNSSLQEAKVLVNDAIRSLKNGDVEGALIHLNLVNQQPKSEQTSTATSNLTKLVVNVHVTNGGGSICVYSKKGDLGCKNATGPGILQFLFSPESVEPNELFKVCIGDQGQDCVGQIYSPPGEPQDVYIAAPEIANETSTLSSSPTEQTLPPQEQQPQANTGTDWSSICSAVSVILVQSCDQLVNSDGSLTADGTHAMHCIRNGALLALGGQSLGIPLSFGVKILTTIAPSFGCDNIVDFHGASQISNLGVLRQIINLMG